MKAWMIPLIVPLLSWNVYAARSGTADAYEDASQTESPYFELKSGAPEHFPLQSTDVKVSIAGVMADVEVTQVYQNTGTEPIEASYVFPGSTRAAVYGLTMALEGRIVRAKIKEKEQAKKIYKKAVAQGKTASLLVQHRPNVFRMKLGNVMPGDEIEVTLSYTELVEAVEDGYRFVYPTVVGPRYAGVDPRDAGAGADSWVSNPYLNEGELALETFNLSLGLQAGLPIQDARVDTHEIEVNYTSESSAEFTLAKSERHGSNRDFVLEYRLAGEAMESGLLLFAGEGDDAENFFLAMIQPPERVMPDAIVPREFIFVVDVSGSMNGFPINTAKSLMRDLFGRLSPEDRFNVLLFAGSSDVLSAASLPANAGNIRDAVDFLSQHEGSGGTELLPALKRAFALPAAEGVSRSVVIVTDGLVTVEEKAFEMVRENLDRCNVYSFGIGSSVNRFIIEGLARVGMGEAFVVLEPSQAKDSARRFREYIESPVLTGIDATFKGFKVYDVVPESIPDVLAKRPVMIFGKWTGDAKGSIRLTGTAGDGAWSHVLPVSVKAVSVENAGLRYLWARHRIGEMQDYYTINKTDERRQAIVNLGLTYSLLTQFTSFVAVDEVVRNTTGKLNKADQPLPLPKGVNNNALGYNKVPGTPEPETWMLMGVVATFLLVRVVRRRRAHA